MYLEILYFTGFSETLGNISGHPISSFYSIRDAEVAGSNPVASTSYKRPETLIKSRFPAFFILKNNFTYSGILSGLERFYANASEPFVLCGLSPGALIENCI